MIYKLGLCGVTGRMGLELASLIGEGIHIGTDYFELCDAVAQSDRLVSVEGVPVRVWKEPPREPVHVWVDFSTPEGTISLLKHVNTPVVIATTGFSAEQERLIADFAKQKPVMLCPNTSIGMNWLVKILTQMPLRPELGYEAVLEESHHTQKKDAPSGSAKRLLQALSSSGFEKPTVHVTRAGDIVGIHRVRFVGTGEEIVLEHRVSQRKVFAKGALLAAQYLLKQSEPRIYRMEEVIS